MSTGELPGGLRGDVAALVKLNLRQLLTDMLSNEELHAECVGAGPFRFRQAFNKDMGAFYGNNRSGCDDLANSVYREISAQWDKRHPGVDAKQWLDRYAPPSPLTEKEIDEAWELEIGSSDSAMKDMYEGSCRIRKGADLGTKNRG
jgi:hypothetical protein